MNKITSILSATRTKLFLTTATLFSALNAHAEEVAGGDATPWEGPLETILSSLTGPIVRSIAVIAIVLAGLGLAFGEGGGGTKKILMIVLGISIAVGASSMVLTMFGFDEGLMIF